MKSIYHYRQLFCFPGSNAFLHCSRMWSVWNTRRMKRDHTTCYILAAHEISIHIINHLVTINITVIIGSWYGLWMIIKQPRDKRTYHKIMRLKGLMNRWWLMNPACY